MAQIKQDQKIICFAPINTVQFPKYGPVGQNGTGVNSGFPICFLWVSFIVFPNLRVDFLWKEK